MKQRLRIIVYRLRMATSLFAALFGVMHLLARSYKADNRNQASKQIFGLIAWLSDLQVRLTRATAERRLLMIYDLSSQPVSIGDFLFFQEASLVLGKRLGLDTTDIALVYEPKQPTLSIPEFSTITEENILYHLASILPVAQVNQTLGSLFIFNSHLHLESFIADNEQRYQVWPPLSIYANKDYLYYIELNNLLYDYYRDNGNIPYLQCRKFLLEWAAGFYEQHAASCVPVTVNLRNNKLFSTERNSLMDIWLEFFRDCRNCYPVKFIIVSTFAEVDERIRELDNVVIAKDHHTNVEQDLTLIATSAMHFGVPSGPFCMAFFGDKPYLMVHWNNDPSDYRGLIQEEGFFRFCFATPLQRITKEPETGELLKKEFAVMWGSTDISQYCVNQIPAAPSQKPPLSWMR